MERWPDGERADDSLNRATEAAVPRRRPGRWRATEPAVRAEVFHQFLRWRQQVLAARIQLAQGDALREADPKAPAAGDAYLAVVERLSRPVEQSEVTATQLTARVYLAQAYDRLDDMHV